PILGDGGVELRHGNGDVIEASDHCLYSWRSIMVPTKQSASQRGGAYLGACVSSTLAIGRLPQAFSTAERTARRTASRTSSPSRVRTRAILAIVPALASRT